MKKRKRFMALVLAAMLAVGMLPTAGASGAGVVGQTNALSSVVNHTGLITADGSLWMWGNNIRGQLGDGTTQTRYIPVKVMDDVATFYSTVDDAEIFYSTAAIKKDGSLWMWGDNYWGQLGDGTTEDRYTPVKIMDDVAEIALGEFHSAALKKDGSLWMWGWNALGQLGDGTTENRSTPVKIMDDVAKVSLNLGTSAAIKKDGSLWMWGANGDGQLGDGTTKNIRFTPVKVMDDVAVVSLRQNHSAAIKKDGSLWMWGDNENGRLGDGTTEVRSTPVKVMDDVSTVSLGAYRSTALKKDGSLWTWGYNGSDGQLGDGTTENRSTPVKIMDDVATVSFESGRSAAIKKDGSLWMWGWRESAELSDGKTPARSTPFKVIDDVATVSLGGLHSAAIKKDGSLWMWGWNSFGQLGDGTTQDLYTLVKVMDNVAAVSLGFLHSVAVKQDGSVWVWGSNQYGQLGMGENFGNNTTSLICQTIPVRLNGLTANVAAIAASTSQYTVTLNLGGGTGTTSVGSEKQALLTPPTNPSRDGYFFAGWFKDSALTQPWNFDTDKVTGNLPLYAKWESKSTITTIAEPSTQRVLIDDKEVNVPTYILRDENNYAVNFVKLRDIAYLLDDTAAQFNVDWRNNAIRLDARAPYTTKNGAELTAPSTGKATVKNSATPVLTGGVTAPLESFLLTDQNGGGHNYFKLRDIGKVAGFNVQWDSEQNRIIVNTNEPYAA